MNIAKFLKGIISIGELEDLPNHYSHTFYKEYFDTMTDPEKQKAYSAESMAEGLSEIM